MFWASASTQRLATEHVVEFSQIYLHSSEPGLLFGFGPSCEQTIMRQVSVENGGKQPPLMTHIFDKYDM